MQLMNEALCRKFHQHGPQDETEDPLFFTRYWHTQTGEQWYMSEYDPEKREFYGYYRYPGDFRWDFFLLDELIAMHIKGGGCINRDENFRDALGLST